MKKFLLLLLTLWSLGLQAQQTAQSVTATLRYWLYLPEGYAADTSQRWPLLIFLHGAGERGDDLAKVKVHGPPKLAEQRSFPFIIASPQCPLGERRNTYLLNKMLDDLLRTHRIDADRVYLTGLSMGGNGTWMWAIENPDRFAAIAPICGWGAPERAQSIRFMPTWVFHGGKDVVVPPRGSEDMIAAMKALGGQPQYTMYPEAGHDSWTESYNNEQLYTWLLAQNRKQEVRYAADPASLARYAGAYALPDGMRMQVSLRDGQLVAGINGRDMPLVPEGPNAFYLGNWRDSRIVFTTKPNGKVKGMETWSRSVFGEMARKGVREKEKP